MILRRYICREIYLCMLGVIGILMLVVFINQLTVMLSRAASGQLTVLAVIQLSFLNLFPILTYVLPLGFFLSIVIVIGRLYRDSEMIVMTACGMSLLRQMLIVGGLAVGVSFFAGILSLYINPLVVNYLKAFQGQEKSTFHISTLSPHRFEQFAKGQVVYVSAVNHHKNSVKDFFLAQRKASSNLKQGNAWDIVVANSANQKKILSGEPPFVILHNGYRYNLNSKTLKLTQEKFGDYGINLALVSKNKGLNKSKKIHSSALTTRQLMHMTNDRRAMAELQLRLSIPLSVLIGSILAVSLSRVDPRRTSSVNFIYAVLLYALYMILIYMSYSWIYKKDFPIWLGIWWVHVLFIMVTMLILAHRVSWKRVKMILRGSCANS